MKLLQQLNEMALGGWLRSVARIAEQSGFISTDPPIVTEWGGDRVIAIPLDYERDMYGDNRARSVTKTREYQTLKRMLMSELGDHITNIKYLPEHCPGSKHNGGGVLVWMR